MDVDETVPCWQECAALLSNECFPASKDDLLAALVRQRAPSRLLRHLHGVDGDPFFANLAEVVHACRESQGQSSVVEVAAHAER